MTVHIYTLTHNDMVTLRAQTLACSVLGVALQSLSRRQGTASLAYAQGTGTPSWRLSEALGHPGVRLAVLPAHFHY